MRVEDGWDLAQVDRAQSACFSGAHRALRRGVVGGIRRIGAERPFQRVRDGAAGVPAGRCKAARDRQIRLHHRIDVRIPLRSCDVGGRRDSARHDHRGGGAHVRPSISVLRRPVGVGGVGRAQRISWPVGQCPRWRAGPCGLRHVVGDDRLRRVHQHLLYLVGCEPLGDGPRVPRVQSRRLRHRQNRRHEGRRAGRRVLTAAEQIVRAVAGDVAARAEPMRQSALCIHRGRVAWEDVVPEHAVGVVHGVEVIGVE